MNYTDDISNCYIRFDWAMKRMLRNKANHAVLEGLMTSLIGEKFTIVRFLESESNQEDEHDKFNRVDILAENDKQELAIFEIQNNRELYYFHRMLYGVSKAITDYISLGDEYGKVRKVYSINIVYFELGQGKDYVYHGHTVFQGIHVHDILRLSQRQTELFFGNEKKGDNVHKDAGELFPEYYVLRVNDFDKVATTPLDEWIAFLKTGNIAETATAPGLAEARECLRIDRMTRNEYLAYRNHMENIRYQKGVISSSVDEGREEGRAEGRAEGHAKGLAEGLAEGLVEGVNLRNMEIAKAMKQAGETTEKIMLYTGLTSEQINIL